MNWLQELQDSGLWILKSLVLSGILFSLAVLVLVKSTRWGHQFWLLARDYVDPRKNIKSLLFFLIILFFNLLAVRISVLLSNWNNAMYNALQEMRADVFWQQMMVFGILATVHISNVLLTYYLEKRFVINWWIWLNAQMLGKWVDSQAYYKVQFLKEDIDNPDQRIQQDVYSFVNTSLSFATGAISSVMSIVVFTLILWNLSGPITIGSVEVPHMMVFLVFIYVLATSLFAFKIGRPLRLLNFTQEKVNATYRYGLIRLSEYAESIAFYRGEKAEKMTLRQAFKNIIDNFWAIVFRTLKLSGFNLAVSQTAVVFPFIIQAGRFFSQQIKLGDLMQTSQAFDRVQTALSFFRNSYDDFTTYRAVLDRLTGFQIGVTQANEPIKIDIRHDISDGVIFQQVNVSTPENRPLIDNVSFELKAGDRLLIKGQSGLGKTSLLRAAAGLWSHADGMINYSANNLFLSQKPYLPQGNLLNALYYPKSVPENIETEVLTNILRTVQLGHLVHKLQDNQAWHKVLSLGEQQRLAFARVLLHKPDVLFLDEASASLDEGLEEAMYRLLQRECPQLIMISIGHRSSLDIFHNKILELNTDRSWSLI